MSNAFEAQKQPDAAELPMACDDPGPERASPEEKASWLSRLCFSWMNSVLWQARRGSLTPASLLDLPSGTDSASMERLLQSHMSPLPPATSSRELIYTVLRTFRRTLLANMVTRFIADACAVGQPILLSRLIRAISKLKASHESESHVALILVLTMALLLVVQSFASKAHAQSMATLGLKAKVGLNAMVYRKALLTGSGETVVDATAIADEPLCLTTLSKTHEPGIHSPSGTGRIVNLLSGDTRRIESFLTIIHLIWSGILETIVVVILLVHNLGAYSALAGLALIVISLPLQYWAMRSSSRARALASHYSDLRMKATRESFTFIRLLKTYCWEPVWEALIKADRAVELKHIECMNLARVYLVFSSFSLPILASIAALMTWAWQHPGANLTSEIVFPTLSLFALLRIPFTNYPYIVMMSIDAKVAFERIAKLLRQPDRKSIRHIDPSLQAAIVYSQDGKDIVIEREKLTVIVGGVGSGKTRLLHALFGSEHKRECEDECSDGSHRLVLCSAHVVFASKQCWLQNLTIRENVLFGRPCDPLRYAAVLAACELCQDASDEFPYGDATMAGEDGSCLSAGQRARICLARSVYVRPEILLLDDPMAAVDSAVRQRIHSNLLRSGLLIENGVRTTVVMTTHQQKWLPLSDSIIVLDHGTVVAQGSWRELEADPMIRKLFRSGLAACTTSAGLEPGITAAVPASTLAGHADFATRLTLPSRHPIEPIATAKMTGAEDPYPASDLECSFTPVSHLTTGLEMSTVGSIMQPPFLEGAKEERPYGPVSSSIYARYIRLAGGWTLFFMLGSLSVAATQISRLATDLWVTIWVEQRPSGTALRDFTKGQMQAVYMTLGCSQLLLGGLSALVFVYCGIVAARKCHATAIACVLKAPMSFFDRNPVGRLLNRFSRDIDAIDTYLMESFRQVLMKSAFAISIIVMMTILVPILLASLVVPLAAYYGLQYFYRPACRELNRIGSVLRSPYYAHVNESLASGCLTSQSYPHSQALFLRKSYQMLDESQRPVYALYSARNWADLRIELVGHASFLIAALICLYAHLSPSMVGLIVGYSRNFSMAIYWFIYSWIELELHANSLERLFHYSEQKFEIEEAGEPAKAADSPLFSASQMSKTARLSRKEQQQGTADLPEPIVEFDNVSLCYRSGLPIVLSCVSFKVMAGEKIGIVGRTGAGKSTLLLALFRLLDPSQGAIRLCGRDIRSLRLRELRKKMALVPQEPVIFSGSIRFNLDPSNSYSEYDLWCALEKAHMRKHVQDLAERLDTVLASNDSRLSIGQKQLLCLARALLLNTPLLLFDETSAHIDYETDALLQSTIHSPEFSHITVLTIAHRLSSLRNYDRILYLADGRLARIDTPQNIFGH